MIKRFAAGKAYCRTAAVSGIQKSDASYAGNVTCRTIRSPSPSAATDSTTDDAA